MAKLLSLRNPQLRINTCLPCINITRTNILPNAVPIPDKKPSDGDMLRNLRIAITPSYGYGSYSFKTGATSSKCSSGLAGDPKRVGTGQNMREEILDKWNMRPKPDVQKEWLKNIMFN